MIQFINVTYGDVYISFYSSGQVLFEGLKCRDLEVGLGQFGILTNLDEIGF
jgi:hypothetical protein